jgi:hypothetical protein
MVKGTFIVGAAIALTACTPDFTDATSLVAAPRLLAVQAMPAEGATGSDFTLKTLYVGPDGGADAASVRWAECLLQKPLGDPGAINPECVGDASSGLVPLGHGATAAATVPMNACELFGPESPPPATGQPSARPTDPDSTGGFYLPIRVLANEASSFVAFERLACQPSGVTQDVFTAFSTGYVLNENPVVSGLVRVDEGGSIDLDPDLGGSSAPDAGRSAIGLSVERGAVVTLRASWPSCPARAGACGGAETYLLIDPTTKAVTTARESMVVSWYTSGGSFGLDRVGREDTDLATTATNTWTAPTAAGPAHLWIVLRDARGGVGWESYTVDVH